MMYNATSLHRSVKAVEALTNQTGKESGMATRIIIECERCRQSFSVVPSLVGVKKYCSRACYRPPLPDRPCRTCGELIPRNRLFDKSAKFCSVSCMGKWNLGKANNHPPFEERFWAKLDKTPGQGPNGDCWIWVGTVDEDGYGRLINCGKVVKIHIHSYRIHKGDIPKGICVCHSCDVRNCGNPAHLWLGDSPANTADMYAKGRQKHAKGQDCPVSKLTEEQALSILRDDRPQYIIADEYGLSRANVCMIKKRKTWKHLTP